MSSEPPEKAANLEVSDRKSLGSVDTCSPAAPPNSKSPAHMRPPGTKMMCNKIEASLDHSKPASLSLTVVVRRNYRAFAEPLVLSLQLLHKYS